MTGKEKEQAINLIAYYWMNYPGVAVPEQSGGGGGDYATEEEVQEAIQAALDSIYLERVDEDTVKLVVGDRELDPGDSDPSGVGDKTDLIDDVYLTEVTTQQDENGDHIVHFLRNNGKEPVTINVNDLDPVLDMQTF